MENLTTGALEASVSIFQALKFLTLFLYSNRACLDSGFFYVINHGISQEFMDEVFYQSKSFFDLPISEKMKVLRNKQHRVPENDPDIEKPLYGPNVWPTAEALEVAKAVSRIIALALDLEVDFFDRQEMLGKPIATLRLLHYEVSDPMKGIYGARARSDFGLITLLATDDVYGLQDAKPQKWEFVAPLKGAFIVNLGDMLERWSNCIFRPTLHRVLGNGQERYSIAYFVEPSHDCVVECLPTCQSQENPPNSTRILKLFSSHTKNDTPNSVVNIAGIFASYCCQDLREASIHGVKGELENQLDGRTEYKITVTEQVKQSKLWLKLLDKFFNWKANINGSIPCPPKEYGSCGCLSLTLKRIFKMNWVAKLVKNYEEMVIGCKVYVTGSSREIGFNSRLFEYANRENCNDNFLYCPASEDIKVDGIADFRKRWIWGEPVIVKEVCDGLLMSSWDPMVNIELGQFIMGYSKGQIHENGWPQMLKLKDWPSPTAPEDFLLYQRPNFISKLPLLEYIHSKWGLLNVAAKLPHYSLQNDVGPKIFISYGMNEELGRGDSVNNLHFSMRDMDGSFCRVFKALQPFDKEEKKKTCCYIVLQLLKLSNGESSEDPIYYVLMRRPNKFEQCCINILLDVIMEVGNISSMLETMLFAAFGNLSSISRDGMEHEEVFCCNYRNDLHCSGFFDAGNFALHSLMVEKTIMCMSEAFMAGIAAGAVESVVSSPFELIKLCAQVNSASRILSSDTVTARTAVSPLLARLLPGYSPDMRTLNHSVGLLFPETFEVAKTISMGPSLKSGSKVGKSGSKVHEPDEHPPQHIS
ncbi:unnamed protein product [Camellia sinensis]